MTIFGTLKYEAKYLRQIRFLAQQIQSNVVSLKIPSKLNFRHVGLASIGLSRPNIILARYHHFKYNVNHDIAGKILFMGL